MAHIEVVVPGADDSNKHLVVPPTPDWDKRDCALAHAQSKVSALFLLPHSIRAASLANPPSLISLASFIYAPCCIAELGVDIVLRTSLHHLLSYIPQAIDLKIIHPQKTRWGRHWANFGELKKSQQSTHAQEM